MKGYLGSALLSIHLIQWTVDGSSFQYLCKGIHCQDCIRSYIDGHTIRENQYQRGVRSRLDRVSLCDHLTFRRNMGRISGGLLDGYIAGDPHQFYSSQLGISSEQG